MSGIDFILTSLCVNITCDVIRFEKSALQANFWKETCISNATCENFVLPKQTDVAFNTVDNSRSSREQKDFDLNLIREKLNGTTLKIVTLEDYPLSYSVIDNGKLKYEGVAFQILDFLSEKFNFKYNVTSPPGNKFGSTDDMDGSLIDLLNKTKSDMVAAFLPIISDARQYIDYSTTTLDEGEWIMIMKRPTESATGSGLLAPFDTKVWILIMVSLFAVGPIIYGLIIARNKLTRDASQTNYSLPHCVWFVYGALMKQGSTLSPVADSTRLLFATWWIFITILTSFYTANLTAFLTLSRFTLPINNVDDIIKKDKHFVAQRGGGVEYAIRNPNEALIQLQRMVENKRGVFTDKFNDTDTLLNYVQKQDYVFIRDRPAINHLIYSDYKYRKTISMTEEKVHCPFAISKTPFMTRKRAFAYPFNSYWSNLFDPELLHLVESGIVKYMIWENLMSYRNDSLRLVRQEEKSSRSFKKCNMCNLHSYTFTLMISCMVHTHWQIQQRPLSRILVIFENIVNSPNAEICPQNLAGTERQLRNGDLLMTYQIMICGFCTSIVVFLTEMIFRFLNCRQKDQTSTNDRLYKKIDKLVIPSITPPPAYASLYNRSRNNNIWTLSETENKEKDGATQYINGRKYMVIKGDDGEQRLIPLRTPSAAIFQYSYN